MSAQLLELSYARDEVSSSTGMRPVADLFGDLMPSLPDMHEEAFLAFLAVHWLRLSSLDSKA